MLVPRRGRGSSIIKVLVDVPPARVFFSGLLLLPRVYFLAILVDFSMGKGIPFDNYGQRNVKSR